MAVAIQVAGPVLIRTGTGSANALEDLGYSAEGVEIEENVRYLDVPGDQNGGSEGIPIDVQYLGQSDLIRFDLTKYDAAVMAKLTPRLKGGTAGSIGTVGTLWQASSSYFRVLLTATNFTRNYIGCLPLEPHSLNAGTKFSRQRLSFICYPISGVLWNTTTS